MARGGACIQHTLAGIGWLVSTRCPDSRRPFRDWFQWTAEDLLPVPMNLARMRILLVSPRRVVHASGLGSPGRAPDLPGAASERDG